MNVEKKIEQKDQKKDQKKIGGLRIGFGKLDENGKPKITKELNFSPRRMIIWALIALLLLPGIFGMLGNLVFNKVSIPLSAAIEDIRAGKIEKVDVNGQELLLYYRSGSGNSGDSGGLGAESAVKTSRKEGQQSLNELLREENIDPNLVEINIKGGGITGSDAISIGTNVLFFAGLVFFFLWMMRQAHGAQDSVFGFGKSNAKLFTKGKQNIRFDHVGGLKEAKQEVEEIVDFLKNPKKYQKLGARTPKGVLLIGPSGTGKTLLARAIAGEADVPFYSMAGSEFMEMLVGVGASRVRDLFNTAKAHAPSIIFIDEIDAIGQARGGILSGGHGEREQTLNQILVEMDGFTPNDNVVVCAASNRPDVLDPALIRPGRFDRRVVLDLPDMEERLKILKIHAKNKPFEKKFSWEKVAKRTVGFSGADLENMLNEAAIMTARREGSIITMNDTEEAATKVKLGPERKRLQSNEERKLTAYHEAGHALVAHFLPKTDPVHRVSIVSRGMALGFTETAPLADKYQQTRSELMQKMAAALGGRTAEELFFHEITGGAASDIDYVTRLARSMVINLGMSDLGPIDFGPQSDTTEYGLRFYEPQNISDKTQEKVDAEVRRIVGEAHLIALDILKKNKTIMDKLAKALLDRETLDGDEFEKLIGQPKPEIKINFLS